MRPVNPVGPQGAQGAASLVTGPTGPAASLTLQKDAVTVAASNTLNIQSSDYVAVTASGTTIEVALPVGPTGPQGAQGPQGDAGPQGAQGIQGAQGAQGSAGPQGFTGPQGAQGAQGSQGAAGPQGVTGPQGAAGGTGPTGPTGTADYTLSQSAQTDSYTLVLGDANKLVEMGKATAQNLTVPQNSSVAFPVGTQIDILQTGAGQVTLVADTNVTINSRGSALKISGQWGVATIVKRATNTWVAFGALTT